MKRSDVGFYSNCGEDTESLLDYALRAMREFNRPMFLRGLKLRDPTQDPSCGLYQVFKDSRERAARLSHIMGGRRRKNA